MCATRNFHFLDTDLESNERKRTAVRGIVIVVIARVENECASVLSFHDR
jgi:hypothetical protein